MADNHMYFLAIMTSLAPLKYQNTCQSVYFICIYVVYYIKEMTLPILLIFYVSKWKNNKKHWKIGIWRHCDVIIGRGKSKLSVGLVCTEMIIVCKFHDPNIIGSRDTEGGPRRGGGGGGGGGPRPPPPPPQSQIDQKSPVWIGLKYLARMYMIVMDNVRK